MRIAQVLLANRHLWGGVIGREQIWQMLVEDNDENDIERYERLYRMVNQEAGGDRETRSSPMMLLCYTNHALDQFLSELLARIDTTLADKTAARKGARGGRTGAGAGGGQQQTLNAGIVRIGGRSKDDNLERYTLRALRDQLRA